MLPTLMTRPIEQQQHPVDEQPQGVLFALFAPYNESVALLGEFSAWQPLPMTRGDDGWWRTRVELADGDYAYQFRVKSLSYFAKGETFDVFDPYALEVTDDERSIIRVRRGERAWTEYQWHHRVERRGVVAWRSARRRLGHAESVVRWRRIRQQGARTDCQLAQRTPRHIGHSGSTVRTITPYPHSAQRNSPSAFRPAARKAGASDDSSAAGPSDRLDSSCM